MTNHIHTVCLYCGSSAGTDPVYAEAAAEFGRTLVARGHHLVYGGGSVGLMGVAADTVLGAGGQVIGIIPERLWGKEVGHRGLSALEIVPDMHTRKARMVALADAFVALPGGFGTLDELFEVLTWQQIGYHEKPVGLLNVNGYFDGLLAFARHAFEHGFLREAHLQALVVDTEPGRLLDRMAEVSLDHVAKWAPKPPVPPGPPTL
jgi:uncharacterized protein (TIGR00730 family)